MTIEQLGEEYKETYKKIKTVIKELKKRQKTETGRKRDITGDCIKSLQKDALYVRQVGTILTHYYDSHPPYDRLSSWNLLGK